MFPNVAKPKFKLEDGTKKGELLLYERDSAFQSSIFTVCGKYILFHGMRVSSFFKDEKNVLLLDFP